MTERPVLKESMACPAHVAIIMDGNGRWAEKRGLPHLEGHRAGIEAFRKTVEAAKDFGIRWLTVYAFSSENWSRPRSEIQDLMRLLRAFIQTDIMSIHDLGVKVKIIGDRKYLSSKIINLLKKTESLTFSNTGMNLIVAFNYGGRDEIVRATRKIAKEVARGKIDPEKISKDLLASHMDTLGIPDPDLVIRTSGEIRLSNFLIWQAAYSELVFLPCLWPDFNRDEFLTALHLFQTRSRRFGSRTDYTGA